MTSGGAVREHRDCPYFGLDYYHERWSEWFFGRETEADRIISNLRASRLTLVHADSGVGKSSLLRAGVVARLQEMAADSIARGRRPRYVAVVFSTWKDDPLPSLVDAIAEAIRPYLADRAMPDLPRDSLPRAIAAAAAALTTTTLLIILDQFEEYFLYSAKEPVPQRLADQLSECVNSADLPANFVIAIREDAYAGLGEMFKGRIANIYGNYLDVAYLTRDEAADAIRRPVLDVYNRQAGVAPVTIEDALVEAVLDQVPAEHDRGDERAASRAAGNGGANGHVAAPLLQLVMETIWSREQAEGSRVLRLKTLQELEGVKRIVDKHLSDALAALSPAQREVAVDAFDHLVTPSGGKIAESIPDLAQRTGRAESELADVLHALDRARILRPVAPPPGRDQRFRRYEIFHDILAGAINRVIEARQADRLKAERAEAERRAQEEQAKARRLRIVAGAACSLLVLALGAGAAAVLLLLSANRQRAAANSRRLAASALAVAGENPVSATQRALGALAAGKTQEARTALRQTLPQVQLYASLAPAAPQRVVAVTPAGRILAAGADGRIRIFSTGYSVERSFGDIGGLTGAALRPNGSLVAATYADGSIRLWSTRTGRVRRFWIPSGGYGLAGVSFSRDGRRLVTAGGDGRVRVWDVATGRQLAVAAYGPPGYHVILSARFSPDGRLVVGASSNGRALVWNAASGRLVRSFHHDDLGLLDAELSPDGTRLVTASGPGAATVYDVRSGRQLARFALPADKLGNTPYMWSASFGRGGRRIVTAGSDGVVRVWNAATSRPVMPLGAAESGAALYATYSPGGRRIVAGYAGGDVAVWDAGTGRRLATLSAPPGTTPLSGAVLGAGGTLAALANRFGTVTVWRREVARATGGVTWRQITAIAAPEDDAITASAFTPDGTMLATASASGRVWLWEVPNGQPAGEVNVPTRRVEAVSFDPARPAVMLTAGDDGCARTYDISVSYERITAKMCQDTSYHMTAATYRRAGTRSSPATATAWRRRGTRGAATGSAAASTPATSRSPGSRSAHPAARSP